MTETPVLLVVVLLAAAGVWLLTRAARTRLGGAQLLRIVAAVQVGPRERVVIVEAEDAWLVLGVAPGRVNPIHTLPRRSAPVAEPQRPFADWLRKTVEKHGAR
jgi:flagellar protein FliO/FliZ